MQSKASDIFLKTSQKLEIMPHIEHAFVFTPLQSISAVIDECRKYEKEDGVLVLHYLTRGSIQTRTCLVCYFQRKPDKMEIITPNQTRDKYFKYFAHKIFKIKFIPFSNPDGSPWEQERITSTLSYFHKLVKQGNSTKVTYKNLERIIIALNGERTITRKTLCYRLIEWLNT
jgi:hypothetical protein